MAVNAHELLGRMVEKHDNLFATYEDECAKHRQTVGVLAQLKAGALRLDQVDVDLKTTSWQVFPDRPPPQEPTTTSG